MLQTCFTATSAMLAICCSDSTISASVRPHLTAHPMIYWATFGSLAPNCTDLHRRTPSKSTDLLRSEYPTPSPQAAPKCMRMKSAQCTKRTTLFSTATRPVNVVFIYGCPSGASALRSNHPLSGTFRYGTCVIVGKRTCSMCRTSPNIL